MKTRDLSVKFLTAAGTLVLMFAFCVTAFAAEAADAAKKTDGKGKHTKNFKHKEKKHKKEEVAKTT